MLYLGLYCGGVLALLRNLNHNALNALGLTVWQPRGFRHPEFAPIVPTQVRVNSRCLILLYCDRDTPETLQPATQKILTGMLSVLELPASDMMQATIYGATPDLQAISITIKQWQPQYILQLDMDLPEFNFGVSSVRTFSPQYLLQNPQSKAQAYKSLLSLRAKLYGTS
jgi:hypothetical protein